MSLISILVGGQLRLPEDQIFPAGANQRPYYKNWGFTVYHTAYGPSPDQQWQALVDKIQAQVADEIKAHGEDDDGQDGEKLLSLLRLDI